MKTTHTMAIQLRRRPTVPIFHGPGTNALGLMRRRNTGMR